MVQPDWPQMAKWRMHFLPWITKTSDTHSKYVTRFAFQLQQWVHERASLLRYVYIVYLVIYKEAPKRNINLWCT